jgi:pilus assembly protein FimV
VAPGDALAPVQRGQTLSQIAGQLARSGGHSLDQTMVALLRANPDAFIRGNVNLLKQGAVLRTPRQEELASIDAAAATAIVREQAAQWRQARAPVPQPAQAQQADASAPAAAKPAAATATAASGARLEIAPAVPAHRDKAGTKSGTGAGDEGDMVATQQLQQAREDLAARDAEVQELRSRVEQLEKLKAQQQQLIALKDSDLAAAQKRLAQSGQTQAQAQPAPAAATGGWPLWLWGGLALLVLGIGALLLSRRRKPSPLPPLPRHGYDAAELAAAVPVVAHREVDAPDLPPLDEHERDVADDDRAYQDHAFERELAGHAPRHDAADADADAAPAAEHPHFALRPDAEVAPAPQAPLDADEPWRQPPPLSAPTPVAPLVAERQEPTWHQGDLPAAAEPSVEPTPAYPPIGRERLELAVAYMDLGDNETARTLLTEVAAGGDPAARAEAQQLLARLS